MNPTNEPTPHDDPVLREALKRCSPATYYAACKFRETGRIEDLRTVVLGVVERFVDRDLRARLQSAPDELRLTQDLGLDSLTMMEIVMLAEEVFPLSVANEELTQLRTVRDVTRFFESKLSNPSAAGAGRKPAAPNDDWDVNRSAREIPGIGSNVPAPASRIIG